MGERVEEIAHLLCELLPELEHDVDFKVTSKRDPNYNCIAWACSYDERWIQPKYLGRPNLDCVVWWPPNLEEGVGIDCLVRLFEWFGFEKCESEALEEGYRKVALYINEETNEWTHASRQRSNGLWTSKLGEENDIQHGTPYTMENAVYGKVFCFMKKKVI